MPPSLSTLHSSSTFTLLLLSFLMSVSLFRTADSYDSPTLFDDFYTLPIDTDRWNIISGTQAPPGGFSKALVSCWSSARVSSDQTSPSTSLVLGIDDADLCGGRSYTSGMIVSKKTFGLGVYTTARLKTEKVDGAMYQFFLYGTDSQGRNVSVRFEIRGADTTHGRLGASIGDEEEAPTEYEALGVDSATVFADYSLSWKSGTVCLSVNGSPVMTNGEKFCLHKDFSSFPKMSVGVAAWPCKDDPDNFSCYPAYSSTDAHLLHVDSIFADSRGYLSCCHSTRSAFTENFDGSASPLIAATGYGPNPASTSLFSCWSDKRISYSKWVASMGISESDTGQCNGLKYSAPILSTYALRGQGYYFWSWQPMKHSAVANTFSLYLGPGDQSIPMSPFQSVSMVIYGRNTSEAVLSASSAFVTPRSERIDLGSDTSTLATRYGLLWNSTNLIFYRELPDGKLTMMVNWVDSWSAMKDMYAYMGVWPSNSTSAGAPSAPPYFDYEETDQHGKQILDYARLKAWSIQYDPSRVPSTPPLHSGGDSNGGGSSTLKWWQLLLIIIACIICIMVVSGIVIFAATIEIYVLSKKLYKYLSKRDEEMQKYAQMKEESAREGGSLGSTKVHPSSSSSSSAAAAAAYDAPSPAGPRGTISGKSAVYDPYGLQSSRAEEATGGARTSYTPPDHTPISAAADTDELFSSGGFGSKGAKRGGGGSGFFDDVW